MSTHHIYQTWLDVSVLSHALLCSSPLSNTLEEIIYYVTCHLIFPTISYIYVVKRVILLAVIHTSLSVLVSLGLITLNSWSGIRHKKSCFQSRSLETSFGDSRGVSGLFNLPQSTDSIKSHLCLIHLSKGSFTEGELIFARASLFDVEDSVKFNLQKSKAISKMYSVL